MQYVFFIFTVSALQMDTGNIKYIFELFDTFIVSPHNSI